MTKKEYAKMFHDFPDAICPREIAAMLRINIKTVYKLIRAGTIPSVKIGREYRVAKSEVINYLRGRDKEGSYPVSKFSEESEKYIWTCEQSCDIVRVADKNLIEGVKNYVSENEFSGKHTG